MDIFYHGSSCIIPFQKFNADCDGSGIVTNNKRYGGFFFTSDKGNSEFYSEWFICKVSIKNIVKANSMHPPTALKENKTAIIHNIIDGDCFSDVVVVPHSNLEDVEILKWIFIGDKEALFEKYDEWFADDDGYITKDIVESIIDCMNIDLNYLLNIDVFKEYYESLKY